MTHSMLHRNALACALALALFAPLAAQAQDAPQGTAAQDQVTEVEKITVTGSRIKRTEIEGPAPVTVMTAEQIKAEGFVTVHDALSTLNEAIGTVEADVQWGSHTPNASPLNLRNMGPNRSLLLVNGRRVADYPLPYGGQSNFANYSNIPAAAVERIEVLTGGASAIYGSDAIAGVVNYVLDTEFTGLSLKGDFGQSKYSDVEEYQVGAAWGTSLFSDRGHLEVAARWRRQDMIPIADRPYGEDGQAWLLTGNGRAVNPMNLL